MPSIGAVGATNTLGLQSTTTAMVSMVCMLPRLILIASPRQADIGKNLQTTVCASSRYTDVCASGGGHGLIPVDSLPQRGELERRPKGPTPPWCRRYTIGLREIKGPHAGA